MKAAIMTMLIATNPGFAVIAAATFEAWRAR